MIASGMRSSQPAMKFLSHARSIDVMHRAIGEVEMTRLRARQIHAHAPRVVQRCIIA